MNPRLLMLGIGFALGYLVGTRDGRGRYEALKAKVTALWEDPRVVGARTDVADRVTTTAKDVAAKATATAKDVAGRVTDAASGVRVQAAKVAGDLRERGEAVVDGAVATAGEAREKALEVFDDDEEDHDGDQHEPKA